MERFLKIVNGFKPLIIFFKTLYLRCLKGFEYVSEERIKTYDISTNPFQKIVKHSYNLGHNILELCNPLAQVRFVTSKTKIDIYYSKLGMPVAPRVVE